jgi:hypothetical protein
MFFILIFLIFFYFSLILIILINFFYFNLIIKIYNYKNGVKNVFSLLYSLILDTKEENTIYFFVQSNLICLSFTVGKLLSCLNVDFSKKMGKTIFK